MKFINSSRWTFATLFMMLAFEISNLSAVETVRVAQLPGNGFVPDVVVDEAGTIHVAYVDSTDLYYVNSTDGGNSFNEPIRINSDPGTVLGGRYRGPDIDIGADGRLHVIWYNLGYQLGLPPEEWGVIYAQIDPGTGEVSGERSLNRRPSDNYSIAASGSGDVAVAWTAEGLFVQSSTDNGETFSESIQVLPDEVDPCECCATRSLFTSEGSLHLIYRDKAENIRDMNLVTWPDALSGGEPDFRRKLLSAETWKIDLCPMTGSFLYPANDGTVFAAWETRSKNRFAVLNNSGMAFRQQPVIATEKGNFPVVLVNSDGQVLVAWKWRNVLYWSLYAHANDSRPETGTYEAPTRDRLGGVVLADGKFLLIP